VIAISDAVSYARDRTGPEFHIRELKKTKAAGPLDSLCERQPPSFFHYRHLKSGSVQLRHWHTKLHIFCKKSPKETCLRVYFRTRMDGMEIGITIFYIPGRGMPHDYFVRVTYSYDKIASMVSLWSCRSEKLVVYEHVGEKTEKIHCHILILGCNIHKKQLRNLGSTCVSLKGNELCSFKECDQHWKTACVYMTKGKLDPKYLKGFSQDEAEKWKSEFVEPPHSEKVSSREKLYNEFFQVLPDFDEVPASSRSEVYWKFNYLKPYARRYAFQRNSYLWTPKAANDYKMLLMTYCFRYDIPIPKDHKFSQDL